MAEWPWQWGYPGLQVTKKHCQHQITSKQYPVDYIIDRKPNLHSTVVLDSSLIASSTSALLRQCDDQPPVLAVLGSVLAPLHRAFSGTGLRTRIVPSDLFRIPGCRIGPVPTCPLFLHFQSPSGTIPVGTTYTTTKPSDIDILAHPKLPSTRSPLQT